MDNLLIWLIILAVLGVAFGPVFLLLPSRRERRLAALRAEARHLGLSVELRPVPKLDAHLGERVTAGGRIRIAMHPSVRYALPLPATLPRRSTDEGVVPPPRGDAQGEAAIQPSAQGSTSPTTDNWRLLRSRAGWVADVEAPPPYGLATQLVPLFGQLPEDAVAVDRQGGSLGCCWLESPPAQADSVVRLQAALAEIAKAVAAWDAEASAGQSAPSKPWGRR